MESTVSGIGPAAALGSQEVDKCSKELGGFWDILPPIHMPCADAHLHHPSQCSQEDFSLGLALALAMAATGTGAQELENHHR